MKKNLSLALAVLLVAICLVMPKVTGINYEQTVTESIEELNQNANYNVKMTQFDAGWFGSKAKVLISFSTESLNPDQSIELVFDTTYGPILFSGTSLFGLYAVNVQVEGESLRDTLLWDEDLPFYENTIVESFIGNFSAKDKIPEFTDLTGDIKFHGYHGEGSISGSDILYHGEIGEISGQKNGIPITVKGIEINAQLDAAIDQIMTTSLYDSKTTFSIERLDAGPMANIENFTVYSGSTLDQDSQLGALQFGLSADSMMFNNFSGTDLLLDTELNKLDNAVFLELHTLLSKIEAGDQVEEAEIMTTVQNNLGQLLEKDPEFNITNFSASLPQGAFKASLNSKLANVENVDPLQLSAPSFWLLHTLANADIEADTSLVHAFVPMLVGQQADAMIEGLVQQGLIVIKDKQYISKFKMENGQTSFNGTPIPLF